MNDNVISQLPDASPNSHSEVPAEIIAVWRKMIKVDTPIANKEAGKFYFSEILPIVLSLVEQRPEHEKLRAAGFHTLISLMGFSPETTVISTAILRPQRVVIVYSSNTADSYNQAFDFLSEHKIARPNQIQSIEVAPTRHFKIYQKVRDCILEQRETEDPANPLRHIVDITGGKKVMSATAAQAAWELNLPLCYVESTKYDPSIRRPLPGHEVLERLPDPGVEKGVHRRMTALKDYRNRNYKAALDAFNESKKFNTDHALEEIGLALCSCYSSWTDLDLPELEASLDRLKRISSEEAMIRRFEQRSFDQDQLHRHLQAVSAVAQNDTLATMATFLELSNLYRVQKRHDFSCLLAYRGMEALVEYGLAMAAGEAFDTGNPNYQALAAHGQRTVEQLESQYVEISQKIDKDRYEAKLPPKIGFVQGVAVLCLVREIHRHFYGCKSILEAVRMMYSIANLRNSSILAHGSKTLTTEDCRRMLDHAEKLAVAVMEDNHLLQFQELRRNLKPLSLSELQ